MLQAANTDLFNPLVRKVHNSGRQNLPFPLQIKLKLVKAYWRIFIFSTLGTNGLIVRKLIGSPSQSSVQVAWWPKIQYLSKSQQFQRKRI